MSDIKIEAIDQTLNEAQVAPVAEPVAPVEPVATETVVDEPVAQKPTYDELVKQNLATAHDKVKLSQDLISKFGDDLSLTVIEAIVADAEQTAKEKIMKPGYDPTKYTDIVKTDAEVLASRVAENKRAAAAEAAQAQKMDHLNAIDEFGINNIHKKEEALKWYAEARGIPLDLVAQESVANKMQIYKAYTGNRVPQTKAEMDTKMLQELEMHLGVPIPKF